jgi:hypothetical protein
MRVGKATAGGRKGIKKAAPVSGAVKFEGRTFCKTGTLPHPRTRTATLRNVEP